MDTNSKDHWEKIYASKAETDLSWFQPYPKTSIDFIKLFDLPRNARIIDIGGGDSHLVDALVELGFTNIYVLDISEKAIERARTRLAEKSALVHWIVSDVLNFKPETQFDFWHDRAAFHFLTNDDQIAEYLAIVRKSLVANGYLVLGTFSENGPKKCSGLEIHQYSESSMSVLFEKDFRRVKCVEENHATPFHTIQNFVFCSFKRISQDTH